MDFPATGFYSLWYRSGIRFTNGKRINLLVRPNAYIFWINGIYGCSSSPWWFYFLCRNYGPPCSITNDSIFDQKGGID